MRQNGEPSVEEILASIKQVIARDSRVGTRPERQRRASVGVPADEDEAEEAEDDVLDLGTAAQVQPLTEDAYSDADAEPALVKPEARESMRDTLAALAMLSEPSAQPQIVRSGETSLEEMTRDLLRPALAEWLDKNLPPMVERLVAAEIARIVGKKG